MKNRITAGMRGGQSEFVRVYCDSVGDLLFPGYLITFSYFSVCHLVICPLLPAHSSCSYILCDTANKC